jgi:prophage regulatory protein
MQTKHQSAPALTLPALTAKLLRLYGVEALTGLKKSAIYSAMANKDDPFPAPVRIGARAVAWRESEVLAWIESRAKTKSEGVEK